jgi:hypothetical protein
MNKRLEKEIRAKDCRKTWLEMGFNKLRPMKFGENEKKR